VTLFTNDFILDEHEQCSYQQSSMLTSVVLTSVVRAAIGAEPCLADSMLMLKLLLLANCTYQQTAAGQSATQTCYAACRCTSIAIASLASERIVGYSSSCAT
jgi:hypothetical protein